jgi:protein-L-isoaspartate(D-aspartate) O-methyltransferase
MKGTGLPLQQLNDSSRARNPVARGASGPATAELTEYLCREIRTWAPERDQYTPSLIVYPADTPDRELAGPAIDKTHSRFVLTFNNLSGTSR